MDLNFKRYGMQLSWQQAQGLIHNYNQSTIQLKVTVNNVAMTLSGLSFPRSEVEAILNQSTDVERVFFALGQHDGSEPGVEAGSTIIMLGMKKVNNQDYLMVNSSDKIFEYCAPCPSVCPTNVNLPQI
ncbi:hypothetical protein [Crocinitomix catalasitica]|uniref:hypothetical protein n=1 Tax=Crocinitomix catalasitica TaxID=184607 RepID=UPI0012F75134|nr:hypothetical protein [Crocinitomix catalasitica]